MSLALSRFVDVSMMSKTRSLYSTSFLTKKDLSSHNFHGSVTRSLQYNKPERWKKFVVRNNVTPPEPPLPSGSPSGSLRNWALGLALTFIIPFITRNWGSIVLLKNKVEHAMEAIEVVAKGTDEILDEITDDLPKNSKLRKTLEAVDEMVERVTETAHIANEISNKVEELEEKLETLSVDKAKEAAAASKRVAEAEETSGQKYN